VLIFGVPIYDTVSVIVVRIARGIPPWTGDRNHFAHRLVKIGMGDRVAVIFSYFITFTVGTVAVLATQVELFWCGVWAAGISHFRVAANYQLRWVKITLYKIRGVLPNAITGCQSCCKRKTSNSNGECR
jgi:hypothetical protein